MDFSLGDVLWAAGIVATVVVIGIVTAVYSACGGSFSLGGVGRGASLFFRALTWRILPALTSWYETNKDRAVNRYEDYEEYESGGDAGSEQQRPGSENARTGTQGGSEGRFYGTRTAPVQAEHEITFEDVRNFLLDHNLTDEEGVDLFTLAKRKSGPFLSANKIRDVVGGSDAEIKARVRKWRGDGVKPSAPPKPEPPVSPIAQRPYDPKLFHSDNPELQYQSPEGI